MVYQLTTQKSRHWIRTSLIESQRAEDGDFVDNHVQPICGVDELAGNQPRLWLPTQESHNLDSKIQFSPFPPCFFSTFAQVSFSATVRLNTGVPGFASGSTQKYPRRSN